MALSFDEFRRQVLDQSFGDEELSPIELDAIQFLSVPGATVNDLSDETIQQYIDAVGGIENWIEIRSETQLDSTRMTVLQAFSITEVQDGPKISVPGASQSSFDQEHGIAPVGLAASSNASDDQGSVGYSMPLRRIDWRGCYWISQVAEWDALNIDTKLMVRQDCAEVHFSGQPSNFEFSSTLLFQPDDFPERQESHDLPSPQPNFARILDSEEIDVNDIRWIAVYIYDGSMRPFGVVVFEVAETDE